MARLVPISWKEFDKFLLFVGCRFKYQKGSHRVYTRVGLKRPIVVPAYGQIPIFIIRNNIKLLGISVDEYLNILQQV